MDIKQLKQNIVDAKKTAGLAKERLDKVQGKKREILENIARLDADLVRAESEKIKILTSFSHDEATAADVEKARKVLDGIRKKRDEAAELLKVVEDQIALIPNPASTSTSHNIAVQNAEAALWAAISEMETDKAMTTLKPLLARLYCAKAKAGNYYGSPPIMSFNDYLKFLFDHLFVNNIEKDLSEYETEILKAY